MHVALRSLPLLLLLAAGSAFAASPTPAAKPAATPASNALTSTVYRINGKRYKKIAAGTSAVYIPSIGMPVASALLETVCPRSLGDKDEVLRIGEPGPLDADMQAAEKDLRAAAEACGSATAAPVAAKKKSGGDEDGCGVEPINSPNGQTQGGILSTKCGKTWGDKKP